MSSKRGPTGYNLFTKDYTPRVKSENPDCKAGEINKKLAEMWNALKENNDIIYEKYLNMAKNTEIEEEEKVDENIQKNINSELETKINSKPSSKTGSKCNSSDDETRTITKKVTTGSCGFCSEVGHTKRSCPVLKIFENKWLVKRCNYEKELKHISSAEKTEKIEKFKEIFMEGWIDGWKQFKNM